MSSSLHTRAADAAEECALRQEEQQDDGKTDERAGGHEAVPVCSSVLALIGLETERQGECLAPREKKQPKELKGGLGGWTNARLPVEAKSHLPSIGLEIYKNLTLGDLERRRFSPGQQIFQEGADARGEAYVVHSGTVEIRRSFDGEERVLGHLGEGELFGEMALFRQAPRSANAFAVTDVELLEKHRP